MRCIFHFIGEAFPAVVSNVEQRKIFACSLQVASLRRMVVAGRIGFDIAADICLMLNCIVIPAMMIAGGRVKVIGVCITAVSGQYIIEIEYENILVRIVFQPVVAEPLIEGAGIGRICGISERRCSDNNEKLFLMHFEIFKYVDIDSLCIVNSMIF